MSNARLMTGATRKLGKFKVNSDLGMKKFKARNMLHNTRLTTRDVFKTAKSNNCSPCIRLSSIIMGVIFYSIFTYDISSERNRNHSLKDAEIPQRLPHQANLDLPKTDDKTLKDAHLIP